MAYTYDITGATGNIDHKITEKLLAEGHKVRAINSGNILNYYQRTPENTTATSIEEFAQWFAAAYKAQQ